MEKKLLCPKLVRCIPAGNFSWVDQRILRDGHLRCGAEALALYLFLIVAGDAQGLSYYGDRSVLKLLNIHEAALLEARSALCRARLIAYQRPLYQVLALPEQAVPARPQSELTCLAEVLQCALEKRS